MGEKKLPMFLTLAQFKEEVCAWSTDTIKRKIVNDGLPAVKDEGGQYLFPRDEVILWFKRRKVRGS